MLKGVLIHFNDFHQSIQSGTGTTIFPFDLQRKWATLYYRAKFEVDRINALLQFFKKKINKRTLCKRAIIFSC
jgi:hypothetical protein